MRFITSSWGYEFVWHDKDEFVGKLFHIDAGNMMTPPDDVAELFVLHGRVDIIKQDEHGKITTQSHREQLTVPINDSVIKIVAIEDAELLTIVKNKDL